MKFLKGIFTIFSAGLWVFIVLISLSFLFPKELISRAVNLDNKVEITFSKIDAQRNIFYPKFIFSDLLIKKEGIEILIADELTLGISLLESIVNFKPTFFHLTGSNVSFNNALETAGNSPVASPILLSAMHTIDLSVNFYSQKTNQFIELSSSSNQKFYSLLVQQFNGEKVLKNSLSIYQGREKDIYSGSFEVKEPSLLLNLNNKYSESNIFHFLVNGNFGVKDGIGKTKIKLSVLPVKNRATFEPIYLNIFGLYKNKKLFMYDGSLPPSLENFLGFIDIQSRSAFLDSLNIKDFSMERSNLTLDLNLKNIFASNLGSNNNYLSAHLESGRVSNLYFTKIDGISGDLVYQNQSLNFKAADNYISIIGFDGLIRNFNTNISSSIDNESVSLFASLKDLKSSFKLKYYSHPDFEHSLDLTGSKINLEDIQGLLSNRSGGLKDFLGNISKLDADKFLTKIYFDSPEKNFTQATIQNLDFRNIPMQLQDIRVDIDNDAALFTAKDIFIQQIHFSEVSGIYDFNIKDLLFKETSIQIFENLNGELKASSMTKGKYNFLDKEFSSTTVVSGFQYLLKSQISALKLESDQVRLLDFKEIFSKAKISVDDTSFNSNISGFLDIYKPELNINLLAPLESHHLNAALKKYISGSSIARLNIKLGNNSLIAKMDSDLIGINVNSPIDIFGKDLKETARVDATLEKINENQWSLDLSYKEHEIRAALILDQNHSYLDKMQFTGPKLNLSWVADKTGFARIIVKDSNLKLVKRDEKNSLFKLEALPNLNSRITFENVKIDKLHLDNLDLYLQKNSRAISLNKINVQSEYFSIKPYESKDAFISYRFDNKLYHLNGIYEFKDSSKLPMLSNSKSGFNYLKFGASLQFQDLRKLKDIEGNLSILGKDLNFEEKIADSAVLNLIGIFNLKRLLGKVVNLDLSLSEYSRTELSRVEGKLVFTKDKARINNSFFVETNAAKMEWQGSIFKKNGYLDSLDLNLGLRIRLQENLPWYAGIIGGIPGVAGSVIFSELFQSELNDLSNYTYKVSGEITNPKLLTLNSN